MAWDEAGIVDLTKFYVNFNAMIVKALHEGRSKWIEDKHVQSIILFTSCDLI